MKNLWCRLGHHDWYRMKINCKEFTDVVTDGDGGFRRTPIKFLGKFICVYQICGDCLKRKELLTWRIKK